MSEDQYPRKGAYLAALRQMALNAKKRPDPPPVPWWKIALVLVRSWALGR